MVPRPNPWRGSGFHTYTEAVISDVQERCLQILRTLGFHVSSVADFAIEAQGELRKRRCLGYRNDPWFSGNFDELPGGGYGFLGSLGSASGGLRRDTDGGIVPEGADIRYGSVALSAFESFVLRFEDYMTSMDIRQQRRKDFKFDDLLGDFGLWAPHLQREVARTVSRACRFATALAFPSGTLLCV